MRNPRSRICALSLTLALPLLAGCNLRQVLGWDMYNQARVAKPYRASEFFEDGTSARPLVAGTVPRQYGKKTKEHPEGQRFYDRNQEPVEFAQYAGDGFPPETFGKGNDDVSDPAKLKETLERGQVVFNIYCAVCHGQTGRGDGIIVQRGFSKPPSFVVPLDPIERENMEKGDPYRWQRTQFLQTAPPRHIYDAISRGFGAMYSYGERVKPVDRWKVAAYVKTLQANQAEPKAPTPHVEAPAHASPGGPAAH